MFYRRGPTFSLFVVFVILLSVLELNETKDFEKYFPVDCNYDQSVMSPG